MKSTMALVMGLVSIQSIAGDLGKKLVSCDFEVTHMDFKYIDLATNSKNLYLYGLKTSYDIGSGQSVSLPEIPVLVKQGQRLIEVEVSLYDTKEDRLKSNTKILINRTPNEDGSHTAITKSSLNRSNGVCKFLD